MATSQFSLLKQRRFLPLFFAQFLGAFNGNFYKSAVQILILFRLADGDSTHAEVLVTVATGLFILPSLLFSGITGQLADKYEKAQLIRWIKLAEVVIMIAAGAALWLEDPVLLLCIVFLLGVQSAFFDPLKYSILPDQLAESALPAANALIEATTFAAILIGMLGGILLIATDGGPRIVSAAALAMAVLGWGASLAIPAARRGDPDLVLDWNLWRQTLGLVRFSGHRRDVKLSILGLSWFWAIGAIYLTELPAFVRNGLHADEQVVTLFLALFSIGVGLGSLLGGKIMADEVSGRPVPFAALAIAVLSLALAYATARKVTTGVPIGLSEFLIAPTNWYLMVQVLMLAIAGGIFAVPLYAIIQARSDPAHKARTIASLNVVIALFVVVAVAVTGGLLKAGLSIPSIFALVGWLSLMVAIEVCRLLPDALIQAILAAVFRLCFGLEAKGIEHVRQVGPRAVIVANHTSFVDALLLAAVLPRRALFAIDTRRARSWYGRIAGFFFQLFPMDPLKPFSTKALIREVASGQHCVIFPEGRMTQTGALMKIYEGPGLIADKADAPVVPVRIAGAQYSIFSRLRGKVRIRWFPKIEITILPARHLTVAPELKGRKRRQAIGTALYDIMSAMMFETERQALSLYGAMLDARHTHGGKALVFEDTERAPMSYDGLVLASTILGRKLRRHTGRGRALGLLLPNTNALATTFMACQAEGIVPAMLNYAAGAAGIQSAMAAAKIDTIVTARVFIDRAKLERVVEELASTKARVLYLEDIRQSVTLLEKLAGWAVRPCAARRHRRRRVAQDDPAVILFTSGTEGTPKGVALSHRNLLANVRQVAARIDFTSNDRVFNALPLFHSFGMTGGLILPMLAGIKTFLYPSPLHYRIVPEMIYDTSATIMFGTDTFLAGYARTAHPYDFYAMRYVFAGAERVRDDTRELWMEKFGLRILEGYGVTECSPVIAVNTPMHFKPGTVGRALPDVECRLEPVPGIANGARLYVRGPNVMLGYLKVDLPGEIQRPLGGWHDTGDIIDADEFSVTGFIRILGRAKRFAKIAGEMVSLGAVEAMIQARWPSAHHAVLALPDPRKGERLVLLTTARDVTRPELTMQARSAGLAELWLPADIFPVDAMPLLGTGKTDYVAARVLAERLAKATSAAGV